MIVESPAYFGVLLLLQDAGPQGGRGGDGAGRAGIASRPCDGAARGTACSACVASFNCHNPLGFVDGEERKREVVELLARHEVPLIEDEVYGDLAFGDERARPGQGLRPRRAGAALCLVLEDVLPRLPRRLDRGRPLPRAGRGAEVHEHARHADAAPARRRRVPARRRLRTPPPQMRVACRGSSSACGSRSAATSPPARASRTRPAASCSGSRCRQASTRCGSSTRRSRRHHHHAGLRLLGPPRLPQLPAPELLPPLVGAHRRRRRHCWASWWPGAQHARHATEGNQRGRPRTDCSSRRSRSYRSATQRGSSAAAVGSAPGTRIAAHVGEAHVREQHVQLLDRRRRRGRDSRSTRPCRGCRCRRPGGCGPRGAPPRGRPRSGSRPARERW